MYNVGGVGPASDARGGGIMYKVGGSPPHRVMYKVGGVGPATDARGGGIMYKVGGSPPTE